MIILPLTVDACPALTIDDGTVTYSDDRRIEGTVANYSCNGVLVLDGNAMRTCTGPGSGMLESDSSGEMLEWDGTEPVCGKFA